MDKFIKKYDADGVLGLGRSYVISCFIKDLLHEAQKASCRISDLGATELDELKDKALQIRKLLIDLGQNEFPIAETDNALSVFSTSCLRDLLKWHHDRQLPNHTRFTDIVYRFEENGKKLNEAITTLNKLKKQIAAVKLHRIQINQFAITTLADGAYLLNNQKGKLQQQIHSILEEGAIDIKTRFAVILGSINKTHAISPSDKQIKIVLNSEDAKVTARAGTGKTTTIVLRGLFLKYFCNRTAEEVMALTFNVKNKDDLSRRLARYFKQDSHTDICYTFDRMAHLIFRAYQGVNPSMIDEDELSTIVRQFIDEEYQTIERQISMYTFFKDALDEKPLSPEYNYCKFKRIYRSLSGDDVNSYDEKVIADYLFERGIYFKYEPEIKTENGEFFYSDFWLHQNNNGFYWEHWAITENNTSSGYGWLQNKEAQEEYINNKNRKKAVYHKRKLNLIETTHTPHRCREEFEGEIKAILSSKGFSVRKLPQEDLLKRFWERNTKSRMESMLINFFHRFISNQLLYSAYDEYKSKLSNSLEKVFWDIAKPIFDRIYKHCIDLNVYTHSMVLRKAISYIENNIGQHESEIEDRIQKIKYLFIDEAQDISPLYLKLIQCLIRINPHVKVFYVGDDWQAINRFAGSDVKIFNEQLQGLKEFHILDNYRSDASIVDLGNSLMSGLGPTALPHSSQSGKVVKIIVNDFREIQDIKYGIKKCIRTFFENNPKGKTTSLQSIMVLFRTNNLRYTPIREIEAIFNSLKIIRKWKRHYPKLKIDFLTAHKSKGAEADCVFIIDPSQGSFPLIHPFATLLESFGDSLERTIEDERRLFYVAITRAKHQLYLVYSSRGKLGFL